MIMYKDQVIQPLVTCGPNIGLGHPLTIRVTDSYQTCSRNLLSEPTLLGTTVFGRAKLSSDDSPYRDDTVTRTHRLRVTGPVLDK